MVHEGMVLLAALAYPFQVVDYWVGAQVAVPPPGEVAVVTLNVCPEILQMRI